jgi:hypothetical protein
VFTAHGVADEEHPPLDQPDRVEAYLAHGIEVVELDAIGV